MKIVIGSRGSALALWQANWVRDCLAGDGHDPEIRVIRTSGDRMVQAPLQSSGVKGLFVKEIEEALLDGSVDVAVHSLKDLPADQPAGLAISAVPAREDARDALVTRNGEGFGDLPSGARLGTSSVRRQSQLSHLRPELAIVPMRGNVDTRLRKLEEGQCDALVLAAAGLIRLGLQHRIVEHFSADRLCPAVGQGALAIETRAGESPMLQAVAKLDDPATHQAVRAERTLLRRLGGGCSVPIAAHAIPEGDALAMAAVVASPDGKRLIRASNSGRIADPETLGAALAEQLLGLGARDILEAGS
jgi:hydroxymethylbilane synthase